jgi:catechol 2,3-dioxygenase-like lactoylglutathione lyase family enzyme
MAFRRRIPSGGEEFARERGLAVSAPWRTFCSRPRLPQPELGFTLQIAGVLETCLYAADLVAAEQFYGTVLGLEVFGREPERHVFFRCGGAMLLVFNPERTAHSPGEVGGVPVPAHGAVGVGHVAFRVAEAELQEWRHHLKRAGLAIEADISWPRGGRSVYVRDPANNSVELASPAIWGLRDKPAAT